jgi:hypothetical protein
MAPGRTRTTAETVTAARSPHQTLDFEAELMPNDHFVARTYLKRWCDRDKNQRMQAYRKPNGTSFPCWPEDVCAEAGGDLNPAYFKDPAVLGQFRAIFEPRWDAAIGAVEKRKLTVDDKFVIAGYWANLLATTPAWRKIGQKLYEQEIASILPMIAKDNPPPASMKGVKLRSRSMRITSRRLPPSSCLRARCNFITNPGQF